MRMKQVLQNIYKKLQDSQIIIVKTFCLKNKN
jgi:hypothetical protein